MAYVVAHLFRTWQRLQVSQGKSHSNRKPSGTGAQRLNAALVGVEQYFAGLAAHTKRETGERLRFNTQRAGGSGSPLGGQDRFVAMKESPLLKKNAQIQLVDSTRGVDQVAQMGDGALAVAFEPARGVGRLPSAARRNPSRRREVMHSPYRLEAVFVAGREHPAVVLELRQRELAFLRLYAGPLDRETVCVKAKVSKKRDIFAVAVIVIAGVAGGFRVDRAVDVFQQP